MLIPSVFELLGREVSVEPSTKGTDRRLEKRSAVSSAASKASERRWWLWGVLVGKSSFFAVLGGDNLPGKSSFGGSGVGVFGDGLDVGKTSFGCVGNNSLAKFSRGKGYGSVVL
jgi:hypothetical protein